MALAADVCIRGAGIVGRTLALLLARRPCRHAGAGHAGTWRQHRLGAL